MFFAIYNRVNSANNYSSIIPYLCTHMIYYFRHFHIPHLHIHKLIFFSGQELMTNRIFFLSLSSFPFPSLFLSLMVAVLWNVHGDCGNYNVLRGHSGAVLELHWTSDSQHIISCSVDKTLHVWDAETGHRVKKMREHTALVNSCCPARRGPTLISGSDDTTARQWDLRVRGSVTVLPHKYAVTTVAMGDPGAGSPNPHQAITGGLDNTIRVWDLRKNEVLLTLQGHTDTITGLRLSPDGSYVLSNAMDNSVRIWDIRPYSAFQRCVKVLTGAQHNYEKNLLRCAWSPDGSKVTAGSADRFVYVWDTTSRMILYKLPGHQASVNEVDFHPTEPIIASCSSDKTIFLGEIQQ